MKKVIVFTTLLMVLNFYCKADGVVVDKVYHPYVVANESEIEWRLMSSQTEEYNRLAQRLGGGFSIAENLAIEGYVIAERDTEENFVVAAYEIELRWMLTEQGQYWADWGAVFELERNTLINSVEASAGLIFEKEFEKTSLTLNLFAIYEDGTSIESEMEAEFRAKFRYRYLPEVQPSIEFYAGENYIGIGPAMMGVHRFKGQKQLKWEAGFITEISNSVKDHTLRFALEYEF